jgi:hypothetical protein
MKGYRHTRIRWEKIVRILLQNMPRITGFPSSVLFFPAIFSSSSGSAGQVCLFLQHPDPG